MKMNSHLRADRIREERLTTALPGIGAAVVQSALGRQNFEVRSYEENHLRAQKAYTIVGHQHRRLTMAFII